MCIKWQSHYLRCLPGHVGKCSEDFIGGMSLATCVGVAVLGNRRTGH